MTKSKTDKHLTLSYKKTISKSYLHPLKGVGNGKIDVLSSKGPPMGRQFFKNVDFSVTYPLKGV